jgi:hypothetical protein
MSTRFWTFLRRDILNVEETYLLPLKGDYGNGYEDSDTDRGEVFSDQQDNFGGK